VTKVSLAESKMSKVKISIDKKYKDQIYETTPFVLMSNIFSQNANAYIVAISSFDTSGNKLLKSGSSVKGITFFEYKFAATGEELKKVMDSIEKQNRELMNQLEDYIATLNTEEFQERMDDLADQITQFSKEQKETFKNDVLPALKNMFNSMIEQLEKQNNKEKSKDLEKQLKEIEEKVDV
jgi:ABC-type transporter Mla subunit MlaD